MSRSVIALPKSLFRVSKTFWISLGIVLWLYFVISHIPAAWGAWLLTRSGSVAMTGTSGTIWEGRASLASVKVKQIDYSLGQLSWKVEVLPLLLLKPCAKIATQMDNQQFDGHVCSSLKGALSLTDTNANFPASLLQQTLPLAIDGQFSLHIDKLNMQAGQLDSLHAKISWAGAKVFNGANWMNIGGLGADLVDDGKKGLSGHVFDVDSPVHMDLVISLISPAGGSVKGGLSMPEAFFKEANAGAWLSMFATQQPNDAQGNVSYVLDVNL